MTPQKEEFLAIALKIKSLGFRVFINGKSGCFGYFSDGTNMGYFQTSIWNGVDFSTCNRHIPYSPTGLYINPKEQQGYHLEDITPELLQKTFVDVPTGYKLKPYQKVVKYDDLKDFLDNYWDKENLVEI